jgi:methylmalonyl-CoA/ethylmalonyl-CoA epimerase
MAFVRQIRSICQTNIFSSVLKARPLHNSSSLFAGPQDKIFKIGRLNHVAIAVPNLEKAVNLYRDVLGAKCSEKMPQPEHGVYTVFVQLGDAKIELLYPLGEKSPIQNFLDKNQAGGMHHICIEVDDIKAAMKDLQAHNIRTLGKEPKIGAHGKLVIFLHPKDCCGTLVELEQA